VNYLWRLKRGAKYDLLPADTQPKPDLYDGPGGRIWVEADQEQENEEEAGENNGTSSLYKSAALESE